MKVLDANLKTKIISYIKDNGQSTYQVSWKCVYTINSLATIPITM